MKIYAACLASYNNGILHGAWIDASSDADEMQEAVNAMLASSKIPDAEEFAIHDYDGLPSSFGEYPGLETIAEFVELCEEFDHIDSDDMAKIIADFSDLAEARSALNDDFCGIYDCFRDYADEAADEMLACHDAKADSILVRYFDYDAFARDLNMDMRTIDLNSGIAVFHS